MQIRTGERKEKPVALEGDFAFEGDLGDLSVDFFGRFICCLLFDFVGDLDFFGDDFGALAADDALRGENDRT